MGVPSWDIESKSNLELTTLAQSWNMDFLFARCTLLHLACIYKSLGVIRLLVEEAGADVNVLTAGQVKLSPLHILLMQKEWEGARYLVERGAADLNLVGSLEDHLSFTSVAKNAEVARIDHRFRDYSSLNPVELLLRMGYHAGLAVLEQMLSRAEDNRIVWQGARQFHLALEGTNPNFVAKVLEQCSGMISTDDLSWIPLLGDDWALTQRAPSLLWLLRIMAMSDDDISDREQDLGAAVAHLINAFLRSHYDLNLDSITPGLQEHFRPPQPLIVFALMIDGFCQSNLLLQTLLQVDNFRLNRVTPIGGRNPMEQVLSRRYPNCSNPDDEEDDDDDQPRIRCWEVEMPATNENNLLGAARLLVTRGLDVTGVVVGEGDFFVYHSGYTPMLQMLYRAGAVFSASFFTEPPICYAGELEAPELFRNDIRELKEWKEAYDQRNRMSLQNICRKKIRNILMRRNVNNLERMVIQLPLPDDLKNALLCLTDLLD